MNTLFIKFSAILSFFIIGSNELLAQDTCNYKLALRVIDLDNGNELANTLVTVNELKITKATNDHGNILFENVCKGAFKLLIQHLSLIHI